MPQPITPEALADFVKKLTPNEGKVFFERVKNQFSGEINYFRINFQNFENLFHSLEKEEAQKRGT